MKTKRTIAIILSTIMILALAACGHAGTKSSASVGLDHMLAAAVETAPEADDKTNSTAAQVVPEDMETVSPYEVTGILPEDRLYCIATYGGKDHLLVAQEHKLEGTYGKDYIHTFIDTDSNLLTEFARIDLHYRCPVCGFHTNTFIEGTPEGSFRTHSNVGICKCNNPWVIGLTTKLTEYLPINEEPQEVTETVSPLEVEGVLPDSLYCIATYGGKDHLLVAQEHKLEGTYGKDYIHTFVNTDSSPFTEYARVDLHYRCNSCGFRSNTYILGNGEGSYTSKGNVGICKCDDPWIIGITTNFDEYIPAD